MPNRILKESICSSEDIDALTWFEEVLYYRLIVNCDDYGRMDGREAMLRAKLFPLRSGVTGRDIREGLKGLAARGCVRRYEVDGQPYLCLPAWEAHQNVRTKRAKYPGPEEAPELSRAEMVEMIVEQARAGGALCGRRVLDVRQRVRVGNAYMDIVAGVEGGVTVLVVKNTRVGKKAVEQAARYAELMEGRAAVVGTGAVAGTREMAAALDVAVMCMDKAGRLTLVEGSSWIGDCYFDVIACENDVMPESNPILSESESESVSISEAEAVSVSEGDEVVAAAAAIGMHCAKRDREIAGVLVREYSREWVLEAIARTGDGPSRTWRYIRGILRQWKARGGMDEVRKGTVVANGYTQRAYGDEALRRLVEEV